MPPGTSPLFTIFCRLATPRLAFVSQKLCDKIRFLAGLRPVYSRASSPMYQSSTFLRAQGVLRKNVRLDFTVGLN